MGGQKAGMIGLLTALTKSIVAWVIPYSQEVKDIAELYEIPIKDKSALLDENCLAGLDFILCVSGRDIVKKETLDAVDCYNVHPGVNGKDPIKPLMTENPFKCQLKAHRMTEVIDEGEILVLEKMKLSVGSMTEVYNQLYPYYAKVVVKLFDKLVKET